MNWTSIPADRIGETVAPVESNITQMESLAKASRSNLKVQRRPFGNRLDLGCHCGQCRKNDQLPFQEKGWDMAVEPGAESCTRQAGKSLTPDDNND